MTTGALGPGGGPALGWANSERYSPTIAIV
jgi:hypothetical protein